MKLKTLVLLLLFITISFGDELRSLTGKGISAYKKGDFATALQYFNEAAEKYPMDAKARFNKGIALGATGNAKEAETMLSSVKFENDEQNAEVLYSRARIAEAAGDAAVQNEQQPNIGEAKKAYQAARALYAQALDLQKDKKARKRTINNIEILTQKIKNLPEEQEQENEQNDENKDDSKNDENKDNQQDKNNENQDENNENEENEQNKDENQQENQENNEDEQEQQEQQQREQDEQIEDAIRLLEHYADDAKELNKPPLQKAVPAENGKDW